MAVLLPLPRSRALKAHAAAAASPKSHGKAALKPQPGVGPRNLCLNKRYSCDYSCLSIKSGLGHREERTDLLAVWPGPFLGRDRYVYRRCVQLI